MGNEVSEDELWSFFRRARYSEKMSDEVRDFAATWMKANPSFRKTYYKWTAIKMREDNMRLLD